MKTKTKKRKNAVSACGTDTNPRRLYEVTVHRTDYLCTTVRVVAKSEAEAGEAAKQLAELQEESAWKVADRDLCVYSIEQVQEGASHE